MGHLRHARTRLAREARSPVDAAVETNSAAGRRCGRNIRPNGSPLTNGSSKSDRKVRRAMDSRSRPRPPRKFADHGRRRGPLDATRSRLAFGIEGPERTATDRRECPASQLSSSLFVIVKRRSLLRYYGCKLKPFEITVNLCRFPAGHPQSVQWPIGHRAPVDAVSLTPDREAIVIRFSCINRYLSIFFIRLERRRTATPRSR